ncbi:acetyltransferase [Pandoraea terrae]|uniref:Acetyltransferase n=1 Tax=Pandoraea terrae TaxID=1537710 RepID=A0A5E4Z2N7_9BURK|nr:DHH family phosphoesterase [Pandoraea terrae]VVE55376.1 acetyltransferase [Pandoraea terrae]
MTHYYAFNGDADGLCALQQLRLAQPCDDGVLLTGVKRDIALLKRVVAGPGDRVTVLDISHAQNDADVARLLAAGATVRYFDHHFCGDVPQHPCFEAHINTSENVCTGVLVNGYLKGAHHRWAVVAAFGDEMPRVADALVRAHDIPAGSIDTLAELGRLVNYNAYGECVGDLHFDPAQLAEAMLPYADPVAFAEDAQTFTTLRDGFRDDMAKACALTPAREVLGAALFVLPDAAWARRASGMLANERMRTNPAAALAVVSPRSAGGYVVSVRVPAQSPIAADAFCREFATGGGRARAAGINHLPESELDRFSARFESAFADV